MTASRDDMAFVLLFSDLQISTDFVLHCNN